MTELTKYYDPIARDMKRQIDTIFSEISGQGRGLQMNIDVEEGDGDVVVTADLPGVKREDIDISVTPGHLQITASRESKTEESKRGYHRAERSFGSVTRVVPIPDVDADKIDARLHDGVLTVVAPKTGPSSTKIEVSE